MGSHQKQYYSMVVESRFRLASDVHWILVALCMDNCLMLIIGNRKYQDRIEKINEAHRMFNYEMIRYESFHNDSHLKGMKKSAKDMLRHIQVIENALKREKERKKRSKKK